LLPNVVVVVEEHNDNAIGKVETMKARDVSKIDLQIKQNQSFFY